MRPNFEIDCSLPSGAPVDEHDLRRAVRAVLQAHHLGGGAVSVALVDDADISRMNREHLGHEGATDVISFALHDPGDAVVGDLYIGWEQARRQADAAGVSHREELLRLTIHGVLHLLGHQHPPGEERLHSPMWRQQEALVQDLRDVIQPA